MASIVDFAPAQVLDFKALEKMDPGLCKSELVFRLIHFWEARNCKAGNVLMGLELLLLDSEANAAQGFIPANKVPLYQDYLERDAVYKLQKFMLKPSKAFYSVADNIFNIIFTARTSMVKIPEGNHNIDRQKFRIRSFADLSITVDTHTDLFDVIGEIRLVKGDTLKASIPDPVTMPTHEKCARDRVFLHLFMNDGETVRVYLWGATATKFRERWNTATPQPHVLLITTVNPMTIRGALTLSSTSSTRLFFDSEVRETESYMHRLHHGGLAVPLVTTSSSAITRLETVTIGELNQFVQEADPQYASFFVFGTIVDVLGDNGWGYISCSNCSTELVTSDASMYCTICKKNNDLGVFRYRLEIVVSDMVQAVGTFVLFDRDATELLGMTADGILADSSSVHDEDVATLIVPDTIKNLIQKSYKFQIKITPNNFGAARQLFTVSRIMETKTGVGFVDGEVEPRIRNITGESSHDERTTGVASELADTAGTGLETKRARLE